MDIQHAVADLLGSGLTQSQLAGLVPCSQSLISALLRGARGARVSYTIACRLVELHAERCAQPAETKEGA
ncbi:helix-turn-helix domain-containing protein [Burkholderia gladioli]|uniref:helix-turn-helix domain-containing protein n=1 Tax=Burkholderia gladioli TaxID=28095 RepID=UPI0034DB60F3